MVAKKIPELSAHLKTAMRYRGRIAPTPTGFLHLGHAATFWHAFQRARAADGTLIFRIEDLDPQRSRPEFSSAAIDDLHWLGIDWEEGPDQGGPFAPYVQSQRPDWFRQVWEKLRQGSFIYPCSRSRRDVAAASLAPHEDEEESEPIFPAQWRPSPEAGQKFSSPGNVNWRFCVPDGVTISFADQIQGTQQYTAGRDFGDFLVWRKDGVPAYELAVVADDHAMQITEVVRGADLLKSTARQILLYQALGWEPPQWAHTNLLRDAQGRRLAKRHNALSLRTLREQGFSPKAVLAQAGISSD